jgi:Trk K+ transport system NAD-binding subunit
VVDGVSGFIGAVLNKKSRGQEWQVAMASTYHNHIIVCGVGRLGYRTIVELLKFGREVVGVESDPNGKFVEQTLALGVPVIIADAGRSENLRKAGVERADAIIPCTDNELRNLDIALDAREANPGIKVVMRMFDADLAERVEKGFGIHTAFSTSALAAPIFAAAAMRLNVKHSFYVGEELLNISEAVIEPGSQLVGWTLKQLETELDLSVVSHQSQARTDIHPNPELHLSSGDVLLVLASIQQLHRLNHLNQSLHQHV